MSEEEDNISAMDETDLEGGTEIPMGLLDDVGLGEFGFLLIGPKELGWLIHKA